ncbi:MAG: YihY/virulence factor BrkB family protein [Chloroflexi bacterium OHK40]
MMNPATLRDLLVESFKDWNEDKAPRLAAALAYYTIFSLAPLLIIAIALAGLFFGQDATRGEVLNQVESFIGREGAEAVDGLLQASNQPSAGTAAAVIGFATLLFGAAGVFGQLKDALNTIWEVTPEPNQGLWSFLRSNLLSFAMVLAVGFLLLVSLLISTALNALGTVVAGTAFDRSILWQIVNFLVQAAITFGLFALIFKELPDAEIAWRDVLLGAAFTTILFAIGRFLISFYLARTATGSPFGAAGSLVVILVWVYFSAQILFFGAEFTQVYARRYGSRIRPSDNAVPVTEAMRAQQGMPDPTVIAATTAIAEGQALTTADRSQGVDPSQPPRAHPSASGHQPATSGPVSTVLAGLTLFGLVGVLARGLRRRHRGQGRGGRAQGAP